MNMNIKMIKGYIFAVLSAIIYGCMPLMAKYIYEDGVNPFTLVFLRNMFSVLPLAVLAYREQKTLKIDKKLLPSVSIISVMGCCITPILLFCSYRFIESGTATVFHFAYPAIVIIGELLFMKKKTPIYSTISVLMCIVGISQFYSPQQSLNLTGSVLALSSGLTFAIYVIMLSNFDSSRLSGFLFSFYITLVSSIVTFFVCITTNNLALPSTLQGWGLCMLFSLLVTTCAVVLFQQSTFLIGGQRSSILSTLEPITSIAVGVILLNEQIGIRDIIGSALVISASLLTAFFDIKRKRITDKN